MDGHHSAECVFIFQIINLIPSHMLEPFQVNRNPISEEMQRMRQHIEYLQAELACYRGGGASDEIQVIVSFYLISHICVPSLFSIFLPTCMCSSNTQSYELISV